MTILIAEDNFDQQGLYKECFTILDSSIRLMYAQNGCELLNILSDCECIGCLPDLILLDLNMPYMDGRTVLARIKNDQKKKEISIVILSASENSIDRYLGKMLKTPFFRKGNTKEECLDVLRTILKMYPSFQSQGDKKQMRTN